MTGTFAVELTNKVALVTRVDGALGYSIALALARSGASVFANGANPARVDALVDAIQAAGGRAVGWTGDSSNRYQVSAMIETARESLGGLDIVINVADIDKRAPLRTLDEYDWRRVVDLNLTSAFFFTQLSSRVMADERGGVIVNVGGAGGCTGVHPDGVAQASTSSALIGLTREAARDLAPSGVRVHAVCCGTACADAPDDVAPVVLFLCSDAAGALNGQVIAVDTTPNLLGAKPRLKRRGVYSRIPARRAVFRTT